MICIVSSPRCRDYLRHPVLLRDYQTQFLCEVPHRRIRYMLSAIDSSRRFTEPTVSRRLRTTKYTSLLSRVTSRYFAIVLRGECDRLKDNFFPAVGIEPLTRSVAAQLIRKSQKIIVNVGVYMEIFVCVTARALHSMGCRIILGHHVFPDYVGCRAVALAFYRKLYYIYTLSTRHTTHTQAHTHYKQYCFFLNFANDWLSFIMCYTMFVSAEYNKSVDNIISSKSEQNEFIALCDSQWWSDFIGRYCAS